MRRNKIPENAFNHAKICKNFSLFGVSVNENNSLVQC